MEHEVAAEAEPHKSLWRRIVDYPLVAMVLAIVLVIRCFTAGMLIAQ
jgi:hypothetical protein